MLTFGQIFWTFIATYWPLILVIWVILVFMMKLVARLVRRRRQ